MEKAESCSVAHDQCDATEVDKLLIYLFTCVRKKNQKKEPC